jgi:hypothetical protein
VTEGEDRLSTSALAKQLDVPIQQLFITLRDYGWIERRADSWSLTPKGEFEGGQYRESPRYGRYIVWPASVAGHPLVQAIEQNRRCDAVQIARHFQPLTPLRVNRLLAELGWQRLTSLGWTPTDAGQRLGAQREPSDTGGWVVTYPPDIVEHTVLSRAVSALTLLHVPAQPSAEEPDLFSPAEVAPAPSLDGHATGNELQRAVCDWLYLFGFAHACRRQLPIEEKAVADFYVPANGLFIDCWVDDGDAAAARERLHRRELYRQHELSSLEVRTSDLEQLDERLGSVLL